MDAYSSLPSLIVTLVDGLERSLNRIQTR